jgi:small subunit ribosomal protein S29
LGRNLHSSRYAPSSILSLIFPVLKVIEGVNLVNSTTPYAYDLRTQLYLQPGFSFQLLQRMLTVNKKAFTEITLPEDLVLEKQTLKAGTTLKEVVDVAVVDRQRSTAQAPLILDAVMKALEVQSRYVNICFFF